MLILFFFLVLKFSWILIGTLVLLTSFKFLLSSLSILKQQKVRLGFKWLIWLTISFVTLSYIKFFCIDIYRVASSSMENTIHAGDFVIVNKTIYGPILNRYSRLSGFGSFKVDDFIVYQMSNSTPIIKRCVGRPGDTISINNGNIFINNRIYNSKLNVKNMYHLIVSDSEKFYQELDPHYIDLNLFNSFSYQNEFYADLSYLEIAVIQKNKYLTSVVQVLDTLNTSKNLHLNTTNFVNWQLDRLDPFVIPKKGLSVQLNDVNKEVYRKIIDSYEKSEVDWNKSNVKYEFKHNYYFLLGDNRKKSIDSRHHGCVPEFNILGKVEKVISKKN